MTTNSCSWKRSFVRFCARQSTSKPAMRSDWRRAWRFQVTEVTKNVRTVCEARDIIVMVYTSYGKRRGGTRAKAQFFAGRFFPRPKGRYPRTEVRGFYLSPGLLGLGSK